MTMPFADLNDYGHSLCYEYINEECNDGNCPMILFLHEGLGSIAQWKDFPAKLCSSLNLPGLLYDRCGYGKSSAMHKAHPGDYLMFEGKIILPAFLEKIRLDQKLILVGHSDGGSIALIFASFYPAKVKALITEAAHIFNEEIIVQSILETINNYKLGHLKKALQKFHGDKTSFIFHNWADTWSNEKMFDWHLDYLLKNIDCPLLAIQGEDDHYGSVKQLEGIVNHVSGPAEAFLVPGCGHVPHFETSELVLEKMTVFINSLLKDKNNKPLLEL